MGRAISSHRRDVASSTDSFASTDARFGSKAEQNLGYGFDEIRRI
jgi:hypothetical protein